MKTKPPSRTTKIHLIQFISLLEIAVSDTSFKAINLIKHLKANTVFSKKKLVSCFMSMNSSSKRRGCCSLLRGQSTDMIEHWEIKGNYWGRGSLLKEGEGWKWTPTICYVWITVVSDMQVSILHSRRGRKNEYFEPNHMSYTHTLSLTQHKAYQIGEAKRYMEIAYREI